MTTEDKDGMHNKLNMMLIGPLSTLDGEEVSIVDKRSGIIPPPWWRGDEEASRTGQMAAFQMRQRP